MPATKDGVVEIIRNYTAARKFPKLIGKTPDGRHIFGGPYTMTQAGVGIVAGLALYWTRHLWWPHMSLSTAVLFALAVVGGPVWLAGRIRPGGRSPLSVAAGCARASRIAGTATATSGPAVSVLRPRRPGQPRTIDAATYIWPTVPASATRLSAA